MLQKVSLVRHGNCTAGRAGFLASQAIEPRMAREQNGAERLDLLKKRLWRLCKTLALLSKKQETSTSLGREYFTNRNNILNLCCSY